MENLYVPPVQSNIDPTDGEILSMLQNIGSDLEKRGNASMANNLRKYMFERPEHMKKSAGKYIQINSEGIMVTDKTNVDPSDLYFNSKFSGLLFKIGKEVQKQEPEITRLMYIKNYNSSTSRYTVPISFGDRSSSHWTINQEGVIDTGCTRTTLHKSVLDWILRINPNYATVSEVADVVGGRIAVQTGYIDLEICSIPYTLIKVNFAELNGYTALIGLDFINNGKLDLDSGVRLSFTRH